MIMIALFRSRRIVIFGDFLGDNYVAVILWQQCVGRLQEELSSQQFSMWIRPLQAEMDGDTLILYAPNRFV